MLILLIAAVSLLAYLGVGVLNARFAYALDMKSAEDNYDRDLEKTLADRRFQYQSLSHSSYCHLLYGTLKKDGCTCGNKAKWHRLRAEIESLNNDFDNQPRVRLFNIFFWWASMIERFIKSGYRPTPKTEEQKLNEWVGYDYVKNDPRYDNSHNETWNAINEKYDEDFKAGHPLAIRAQNLSDKIRRASMPSPDPSLFPRNQRKITTSIGPK